MTAIQDGRVRVLAEIAQRYMELVDPVFGRDGFGSGEGSPHMPSTYTPTLREFERLMARMRKEGKQKAYKGHGLHRLAFHLQGYYTTAERVIRLEPVMRTNRKGRLVAAKNHRGELELRPQIRYRRHPDARQDRADLAVEWIAREWRLGTEPMLPREVYEVAA
jgi:hypothetical protein